MTANVDACIVLFRSASRLPSLLDSLRSQSLAACRWIFCINGEDDGASEVLERLPEDHEVLRPTENLGYAGGMNLCIAKATSPFVLLITHDVSIEPTFIARALEAMKDPTVALVGGKLVREEGAGTLIDSAGLHLEPWWRFIDIGAGREDDGRFDQPADRPGLCGALLLARRQALIDVAFEGEVFDSDYFMYKEDQDLGLRLRARGHRLRYIGGAPSRHDRGFKYGRRRDVPAALRRRSYANRHLLILSHWRAGRDLLLLPLLIAFEILVALRLALSEPATLSAWCDVWHKAPKALRKREHVRRLRRAAESPEAN